MSTRILVVEDDPVSREVVVSLLTSRGYEVDTVEDGFGALRMAQDTDYGLVLIDYHLPEMDGYALARLMRSLGEKTNADLKMVAITADHFGLAARRGVDKIFDCLLAKPIAPDDLFAVLDQALGRAVQDDLVESFLGADPEPVETSGQPGLALWQARGFSRLPTAKVFPAPTALERASIATCFEITEAASADCILLLRPAGLSAVETLRRESPAFLMPLIALDRELATIADVLFEPGDGESWTRTAELVRGFAARRELMTPEIAASAKPEMRLAAYMFAADRGLELYRGPQGQMVVPYSAGFPVTMVVEAVKRLAGRGLIQSKLETSATGGPSRLLIELTAKGIGCVQAASFKRSQAGEL